MTQTSIPVAGTVPYLLIGLSAFAMGMQMNAIRLLHVPGISTTAATATFISFVSGIATRSIKPHVAFRLGATLVGMAAGALVGNVMLNQAHGYAPPAGGPHQRERPCDCAKHAESGARSRQVRAASRPTRPRPLWRTLTPAVPLPRVTASNPPVNASNPPVTPSNQVSPGEPERTI